MIQPVEWISAHLYFRGELFDGQCDRLIRRVVRPLVTTLRDDGIVRQAFFVRYSDPNPHLRLRLLTPSAAGAAHAARAVEHAWTPSGGRPRGASDRLELRWVPYEPELLRYGGAEAIPIVEQLFDASSTLAFSVLTPSLSRNRDERLGTALVVAIAFLHAFLGDWTRVSEFTNAHAESYVQWSGLTTGSARRDLAQFAKQRASEQRVLIRSAIDCVETGRGLPRPLAVFSRETATARKALECLVASHRVRLGNAVVTEWPRAAETLAISLLHMTHNRLGVTRLEEALLALVLRECGDA